MDEMARRAASGITVRTDPSLVLRDVVARVLALEADAARSRHTDRRFTLKAVIASVAVLVLGASRSAANVVIVVGAALFVAAVCVPAYLWDHHHERRLHRRSIWATRARLLGPRTPGDVIPYGTHLTDAGELHPMLHLGLAGDELVIGERRRWTTVALAAIESVDATDDVADPLFMIRMRDRRVLVFLGDGAGLLRALEELGARRLRATGAG